MQGVVAERGKDDANIRDRKVDVIDVVVACVAGDAVATDGDVMSRLPSSHVALALALERSSVPILAIAVASDFLRSLEAL